MNPLVTIAIPCFDAERWLPAAIESALAQTWPACEIIVVDDGSTDRSLEIASQFGDRIGLLHSSRRGAPHARNLALNAGRGEWLQFLDADDYLEPEKIAQQFAETHGGKDADVIYSSTWIEEAATHTRSESPLAVGADLFTQWLRWELPQTGGALWRKSALVSLGGWKVGQPCCQEHELYLRALMAGLRFVHAPTPHAVYRIWSDDTLCRKDPRLVIRVKTALIDELHAWLAARNLWTGGHRRAAGRACFEMARTLARHDLAEAVAYHRERAAHHFIHLEGPAAPLGYRLVYRAAGFAAAEKLAAVRR